MARNICVIFLVLLGLFLPGCNFYKPSSSEIPTVKITGSSSMLPISETLAGYYEKKHPEVRINVQGGDSSIGMKGVVNGIIQIGALSRTLTPGEREQLKFYVIASDQLAIIINHRNRVQNLDLAQIREIFSGKITNWKELGGSDHEISVIAREEGSGTHIVFQDVVMEHSEKVTPRAAVVPSTGVVKAIVARDKYAIGYVSSNYLSKEIKPMMIKHGEKVSYYLNRPLIYVTRKQVDSYTKDFLKFATGSEARQIIERFRKQQFSKAG